MGKYWLVFLFCSLPFYVFSQSDTTEYEIRIFNDFPAGEENEPILFCKDSIIVAPFISIEGDGFNESNEGIRISIVNYKRDEDILVYHGLTKFNTSWNNYYGYLEITGIGTAQEYRNAARQVYYKNLKALPTLEDRFISITLKDADYLPATKHFYKYIPRQDITWTEARDSASKMSYNGLQGYLATIMTSTENDFIWNKIDGVGWIGASDSQVEGEWRWVTGPESGTLFWRGASNGTSVNGNYSNWASGEPNNNGNEDYAHINQSPDKAPKSWNDLQHGGDGPESDYYRTQGFVVEFGGMPGDPELQLSASHTIEVNKIAFSNQREFEICLGESIRLNDINLPATHNYLYSWSPTKNMDESDRFNPLVTPTETTIYSAVGELQTCNAKAHFKVKVNPVPVSELDPEYTICEGSSITLNPGEHSSYLWESGETSQSETVSEEGTYSVQLKNDFQCETKDSTIVKFSVRPKLDYNKVDTLVCGTKIQQLNLAFESGSATTLLNALQSNVEIVNEATLSPIISVDEFGVYNFRMEIVDQFSCVFSDTLNIKFHNQPIALFQLDEAECEGYNLKLNYAGETFEDALYNWYSNDTLYFSGLNVDSMEIPLGFGAINRSVGLKINEQGCIDSLKLPVTVTPILNFWAENSEGCTPLNVQFDYSATEQIDNFYWDFGDGINSIEKKPTHVFQNAGTSDKKLNVSLEIISAEGCENKGTINNLITVHPIPATDLSFEEYKCNESRSTVNYVGSGNEKDTYIWDLSDFISDEIINNPGNSKGPLGFDRKSNPQVEIGIQVISEFGCESEYFSKSFKRKPLFEVAFDETGGCPPLAVNFQAQILDEVDEVEYLWDFGDGSQATGKLVTNSFVLPDTDFDIQIIANSTLTGCSDTILKPSGVKVFPKPVAAFKASPNTVLISYPVIYFENESTNANLYEWNFDDLVAFSDMENPEHRFSKMGFFDVLLIASNEFGCVDSISQQISVAFDKIYSPNAFSPNASFDEDREFRIHSEGIADEGYQLLIFNRWGETIFESTSQNIGWDGKMKNGNYAPAGVYTWVIQYLDFRGEKYKQQGTVTLLF